MYFIAIELRPVLIGRFFKLFFFTKVYSIYSLLIAFPETGLPVSLNLS